MIIIHEPHLTDGEIARLIEHNLDVAESRRILEHLRSCKRCFDTYQDSAVYNWLFESDSPLFASRSELKEVGLGVVPAAQGAGRARKERSLFPPAWRPVLRIAAVCAVVFVAVVIWHRSVERGGNNVIRSIDLSPVRGAIETASRWGPCILPGGEHLTGGSGFVYRSGSVPLNDSLESSLEHLYSAYRAGGASSDVAYYLVAGKYVTGQIDIARDLTAHARERYPGDSRIAIVEALIAYTDGDYNRSESLFRTILEKDPDSPIASLNLAIVLAEHGDTAEARVILENVQARQAGTALASRAKSILLDMENR